MHAVLESIETQISGVLHGLDGEASQKHPNDQAHLWSVQQVVDHLALSYRLTARELETRLHKGHVSRSQRRSPLQWILQLMVLSFGHLPGGVPALEETVPAPDPLPTMDGDELAGKLRTEMKATDDLLDRCRQRFGMDRVAVHPLLGPLRVDQWRRYHAVDTLHHLEQLRLLRQQVAPQLADGRVFGLSLAKEMQIPSQRPVA